MLLGIDIGNTTIACGMIKDKRVVRVYHVDTTLPQRALRQHLGKLFVRIKKKYPQWDSTIICSVVPNALQIVNGVLQRKSPHRPLVVGKDMTVPLRNRYRYPKQVGQDRLVGAYAAIKLYGVPVIVIDLGTAITLEVVSKRGEYLGGVIVPGLRLSAESLFAKTALLPKIKIKIPHRVIGRDTASSILSGLFYGFGALCTGLIDLISSQMKDKPKIVLTGGHAVHMRKFIRRKECLVDRDIVFKGLGLLHKIVKTPQS